MDVATCRHVGAAVADRSFEGRVSRGRRLLFVGVVFAVCWLLIEIGLWTVAPVSAPYALDPNRADVRGHNRYVTIENPRGVAFAGEADPVRTPGIEGAISVSFNEYGFRSPRLTSLEKPPRVTRIFCLGGSTTACLMLDDKDAWPEKLQGVLANRYPDGRFDVVNAGANAGTTRDDLNLISQRVLVFEPDVLVMLVGVNDWRIPKEPDYSPIRMENGSYRGRRYAYLYRKLKWMGIKEVLSTSQLFRRLVHAKRRVGLASLDDEEWDLSGRVLDQLRAKHARRRRESMPPDLLYPKPEYSRNLRTILGMCRAHRVRLVLVTQPVLWHKDMSDDVWKLCWMGFRGDLAYEPGDLALMMDHYNQALLDLGAAENVFVVDAARRLPKDTSVFYDDCHFNISGASKLADLIAEAFIDGNFLTRETAVVSATSGR